MSGTPPFKFQLRLGHADHRADRRHGDRRLLTARKAPRSLHGTPGAEAASLRLAAALPVTIRSGRGAAACPAPESAAVKAVATEGFNTPAGNLPVKVDVPATGNAQCLIKPKAACNCQCHTKCTTIVTPDATVLTENFKFGFSQSASSFKVVVVRSVSH